MARRACGASTSRPSDPLRCTTTHPSTGATAAATVGDRGVRRGDDQHVDAHRGACAGRRRGQAARTGSNRPSSGRAARNRRPDRHQSHGKRVCSLASHSGPGWVPFACRKRYQSRRRTAPVTAPVSGSPLFADLSGLRTERSAKELSRAGCYTPSARLGAHAKARSKRSTGSRQSERQRGRADRSCCDSGITDEHDRDMATPAAMAATAHGVYLLGAATPTWRQRGTCGGARVLATQWRRDGNRSVAVGASDRRGRRADARPSWFGRRSQPTPPKGVTVHRTRRISVRQFRGGRPTSRRSRRLCSTTAGQSSSGELRRASSRERLVTRHTNDGARSGRS